MTLPEASISPYWLPDTIRGFLTLWPLMSMQTLTPPTGKTHTGFPRCTQADLTVTITADLLAKRPEEYKLLFIISDGQPADYTLGRAYGGDPACKDIQQVVKSYEQKGVEFIACAIGSDKEQIEKIYGKKRFVDITNLDLLPKAMVCMLKKRILH